MLSVRALTIHRLELEEFAQRSIEDAAYHVVDCEDKAEINRVLDWYSCADAVHAERPIKLLVIDLAVISKRVLGVQLQIVNPVDQLPQEHGQTGPLLEVALIEFDPISLLVAEVLNSFFGRPHEEADHVGWVGPFFALEDWRLRAMAALFNRVLHPYRLY